MAFASSLAAFGLKPATQPSGTNSFANAPPLGQNQPQQGTFGTFGQNTQQNQQQPNQQTTAPASSLFGQPQQPIQQTIAPANSLFGQPQQQQPAPASSLFAQPQQNQQQPAPASSLFGQPQQQNSQQPAPASSLFGQPQQPNPQQPAPASTLFGQPQQQNQSTLPPGSLFGQPQTQTPNPTLLTGNLFGQQQQQPQQQNQSSIFGQPQQNQTLPTGSLFGQPQQTLPPGSLFGQQPQQQQQQSTNIFGGGAFGTTTNTSNTQQPQKNVFGLGAFGTNTQQQQPQQSLFGSTSTNATNPLQAQPTLQSGAFGTNTGTGAFGIGANPLFNKSQQPQQQGFGNSTQSIGFSGLGQSSLSGSSLAMQGPPPFTKSTKFNDLPDNIKKVLEQIDSHIQGRIQISKDLQQRKLGDEATKGNESIRVLRKDLINTATVIRNDLHLTQDVKAKVDQAVEDTIVATRIIDGFRNPQSGNTYLKDHASFPLEYFTRVADLMKERLAWYKATIEQIERKLSSSAASAQTPQGISATLQVQHGTFLSLASKTAAVDTELQKIKALYTLLWRSKTGSVRDPFNDDVKRSQTPSDFGLGNLNV